MGRTRVYIKPFLVDGSGYAASWTEVTKDVLDLGTIQQSLDISDFDVGIFTNSAVDLKLRNSKGLYSDVDQSTSIFKIKRSDSLVKITWDIAETDYVAPFASSEDVVGAETLIFEGILSDDATVMGMRDQAISFQVMGFESILDRVLIDSTWSGALPADNYSDTMLKRILAIAAAATTVPILTVDNTKIVSAYNALWNDLSVFTNKTAKEAVNLILTAANSALYMIATTPYVSGRTAAASVSYAFYGPASTGRENILDLSDVSTGLNRTFNVVTWTDDNNPPTVNLSSSDVASVTTYGARKKNVTVDGITTTATQQAIIDAIRTEFANPKQELKLVTPMNLDTVAIGLLSRVTIDFPTIAINPDPALYGTAVYGVDQYSEVVSTFSIDSSSPFKVIAIDMDPSKNQITFNLRRVA